MRDSGSEVFLVGGCVRDRLLGLDTHDLDLTTNATPEALKRLFPEAQEVGAHFGVVLIRRDDVEIQVATYRSEDSYLDGRRPARVRFENEVAKDVQRRDFTVNGLLEDPFTGAVTDLVGGLPDLNARLIRAIGAADERFAEDHLRVLRAVRLAARLRFHIEVETMAAIRRHAASITSISAERIRDEISRILVEGQARRGFELLDESGLLQHLLPEIARMKGVSQPPEYHPEGDVWIHTLGLLERLTAPSLELAWGALLHDVGKPVTQTFEDRIRFSGHDREGVRIAKEILGRLRYPAELIDDVCQLVGQHMKFNDALKMTQGTFKKFVRQPVFPNLLELHRLDLMASERPLVSYESVRDRLSLLPAAELRPRPLLSGKDLLRMGYSAGPRFSHVLRALEDEQLEGRVSTREQAEEFVRRVLGPAST